MRLPLRRAIRPSMLAVLGLGSCLVWVAAAGDRLPLEVSVDDSRIGFEFRQMGVTVRGGFESWDADIVLDDENVDASRARIVVKTDSIRTGHRDTDAEVRRPSWLDVERFPEAVFESESVRQLDDGRYEATGSLRIRDKEETVVVPFTMQEHDDGARELEGSFTIKRADFDVGGGMWGDFDVVANEIRVTFRMRAVP